MLFVVAIMCSMSSCASLLSRFCIGQRHNHMDQTNRTAHQCSDWKRMPCFVHNLCDVNAGAETHDVCIRVEQYCNHGLGDAMSANERARIECFRHNSQRLQTKCML